MTIPAFPEFSAINLDMRPELHPILSSLPDGVSEFTFAGLYLFRNEYSYEISRLPDGKIIGKGNKKGFRFVILPQGLPDGPEGEQLFQKFLTDYDYIRAVSERHLRQYETLIQKMPAWAVADRDNYDYLYDRDDMAELSGKKFHKKRNLIHNFERSYPEHHVLDFKKEYVPAALRVLDIWRDQVALEGDYREARDAVELFAELGLSGSVVCIEGQPAAFALGESIADGSSYVIHVEKGDHEMKGIYQYIFREMVRSLPESIRTINREQDVGDPGLRQAKQTYRPIDYTRKFQIWGRKPEGFPETAYAMKPGAMKIVIPEDYILEAEPDSAEKSA